MNCISYSTKVYTTHDDMDHRHLEIKYFAIKTDNFFIIFTVI